jgi:hypothetical protein
MHDHDGNELKVGDLVGLPCVITELSPQDDYCNVSLETIFGRRPDGMKETIQAINTAVLVLAKPVPVSEIEPEQDSPQTLEEAATVGALSDVYRFLAVFKTQLAEREGAKHEHNPEAAAIRAIDRLVGCLQQIKD